MLKRGTSAFIGEGGIPMSQCLVCSHENCVCNLGWLSGFEGNHPGTRYAQLAYSRMLSEHPEAKDWLLGNSELIQRELIRAYNSGAAEVAGAVRDTVIDWLEG